MIVIRGQVNSASTSSQPLQHSNDRTVDVHSVDNGVVGNGVVGEKLRGVVSPMTSSDSQKTCRPR